MSHSGAIANNYFHRLLSLFEFPVFGGKVGRNIIMAAVLGFRVVFAGSVAKTIIISRIMEDAFQSDAQNFLLLFCDEVKAEQAVDAVLGFCDGVGFLRAMLLSFFEDVPIIHDKKI